MHNHKDEVHAGNPLVELEGNSVPLGATPPTSKNCFSLMVATGCVGSSFVESQYQQECFRVLAGIKKACIVLSVSAVFKDGP